MNQSPLAEVIRDKRINSILEAIRQAVRSQQPFTLGPKDIDYIRRRFSEGIALGERMLNEFARNLLEILVPGRAVDVTFIVWGRCPQAEHDEIVRSEVDFLPRLDELKTSTDSERAFQYRPRCRKCGSFTTVSASFLRYTPKPSSDNVVVFLQTRIKSTSNLSYKVADLAFDIDYMFRRDKIHNEFSQVITDMYGIKIVLTRDDLIKPTAERITTLPGTTVVEINDYTGARRKKSGFEAYKLVTKRDQHLFEIQLQSKKMYDNENNSLSASHHTYRERQMAERRQLGKEYIDVYKALTKILTQPKDNFCDITYIELGYGGKGSDDEF